MAVATPAKRSLAAVDTNVLMDMAEGHRPTLAAVAECVKRPQLALVVTPTVVHELSWGSLHWETPRKRAQATKALASLLSWGIKPMNLVPVGHGICAAIAQELARRGYLPEEEKNDAFILAEAALMGAKILLTWDEHLLGIAHDRLSVLLGGFDVAPVLVVSPAKINQLFR